MNAFKKVTSVAGRVLAASRILPRVMDWRGRSFILMFHGIGGREMPARDFSRLLDGLGRWFQYRPLDDLLSPSSSDRPRTERPSLYLTFDDGLRNNLSTAYPALKERAIPATFYVCPDLIESGSWIWTHEVRERLKTLTQPTRSGIDHPLFQACSDTEAVIEAMKGMPTAERRSVEAAVRKATSQFAPSEEQRAEYDLMSWQELTQLDPALITIGSHTMTHAMLGAIDEAELEREVMSSRSALEKALGREVVHFCYPGGKIGPAADALVRQTYRTAVTCNFRALPTQTLDLHLLPRFRPRGDIGHMALALALET